MSYDDEVIPLICLDVDGTLVGSSGVVTNRVWEAVAQALARGQHLALSTARGAFGSSWDIAQRLDPNGWHVFHAGGAIVHADGQVRGHQIDQNVIAQCCLISDELGQVLELYSATCYVVDSDQQLAKDHADLMAVPFLRQPRSILLDSDEAIVRLQFVSTVDRVDEVTEALSPIEATVTSATSPVMPGAVFVSITSPGITKATGVEAIAAELGLTLADVMMVGDGHNDLPALKVVAHPVAMGNAEAEVLAVSKHVVPSVLDDGVVQALELSTQL